MKFKEIIDESYKIFNDKGWNENRSSVAEIVAHLHAEVSEIWEAWRMGDSLTEVKTDENGKLVGIPTELADVVIFIMNFCSQNGIDLEKAILEKNSYNSSRPYRHSKKR